MQAANECLHALRQEVQSGVHADVSWEGQQVRKSQSVHLLKGTVTLALLFVECYQVHQVRAVKKRIKSP